MPWRLQEGVLKKRGVNNTCKKGEDDEVIIIEDYEGIEYSVRTKEFSGVPILGGNGRLHYLRNQTYKVLSPPDGRM